jgi:hypothetical protein
VLGGIFSFRGYEMVLYVEPEGLPARLEGLMWNGDSLRDYHVNLRIRWLKIKQNKYLSQVVEFRWS